MNPNEILAELRRLVDHLEIKVSPMFPDSDFKSSYPPISTCIGQLLKEAKPETAAEGLFRPLAELFFSAPVIPQVGLGSGFVDFKLDAKEESSIVIELKPLFRCYDAELLKSHPLEPASHQEQIQKYLKHSEYVILTDLRDAYLYSARDVWEATLKPFKKLSFADLLENALARRSLLDVLRDAEDGEVRPDLDRAFFKDLQDWFRAFAPVRFKDENKHDELVIQLLNQLIFAKTMEDYSLVRYRQLQDDWSKAKERWSAKGSHRIVWQFLKDFEEFFEDYYDTELFERSIWNELDPADQKNLDRFARLLEAVLGMDDWSKTFQRGIVHYFVVEKGIREELLRKEIFRLAQFVRDSEATKLEGKPVPTKKDELTERLRQIFKAKKFKVNYEAPRLVYRKIGSSTNERTLISSFVDADVCLGESLNYLTPLEYEINAKGELTQTAIPDEMLYSLLALLNSLVLNYYIRNKISANVNLFYLYELPIPKLSAAQKKKLAEFAAKLLKNPRDVKERAALETFIARELYGLAPADWKHLTDSFTFGGGDSKAELDEIIRQSLALWAK